jgi:two-component system response regulator GlrR
MSATLSDRPTGRRRSDRIVGASSSIQRTIEQATTASLSPLPVLLSGPSGAGKQHLARAIHSWGRREGGPFVVLSVAGTPESLHERELLGIPDGRLAAAANGTLLVKGIDRLVDSARMALIQTLKEGAKGSEVSASSARIIVTSERAGTDQLGDVPCLEIAVAPLSERSEDVLSLAAHFLSLHAEDEKVQAIGFTADARRWLAEEQWSGNARELSERVRQAVRLGGSGAISAEALMLGTVGEEVPSFKEAKRAFETRYVEGLLRRCGGNISRAARLAKKDRKDFYDVIRRTGVDPAEFRN